MFLDFIRDEKRRRKFLNKTRNQRFWKAHKINIVYFFGEVLYPTSVTERNNALFSKTNHSCLIW